VHFEWDPVKAKKNVQKHGVSFDEAVTVFYDPLSATFDDPDYSIGEHRGITIGLFSHARLVVVSHAERGGNLRIINARPITAQERKRHEG
jgi:uncharacterized DUF497 family protein